MRNYRLRIQTHSATSDMVESSKWLRVLWMCGALLAPVPALANDMPPLELLLIPPFLAMIAFTAIAWFATRWVKDPTARHFTRLLALALPWTPVPAVVGQGFGFSGFYLLSFLLSRGVQYPYVLAQLSHDHLVVAIAMSVICVLGGVVILARSWARLRAASAAGAAVQ